MICIQEMKSNNINAYNCFNVWGSNNVVWKHYVWANKVGGILTI